MTEGDGIVSVLGGLKAAVRRIEAEQLRAAERLTRLVRELKDKGVLSEADAERLLESEEDEPA